MTSAPAQRGHSTETVGTCCIVLHTHLPWLLHHGSWPVGEEWLYQAWAHSYLPVVRLLERLAERGERQLLTVGVTPVLAAQLDDPYSLRRFHTWVTDWQLRAGAMAAQRSDSWASEHGRAEHAAAALALGDIEGRWRHGASPVFRRLVDDDVVELLGGPATHPFQPVLDDRLVRLGLEVGTDDARLRLGRRHQGLWAPECAYRPGLEEHYQEHGYTHVVVDGPTLLRAGRDTSAGVRIGDSDVVAFGRDLDVTYRVWSPRRGYPGGQWYRDFHTFDHEFGLHRSRVTSQATDPADKQPYDAARAHRAVDADVDDFVSTVRQRLLDLRPQRARPLVVVAYDTELFGHWWHEGPAFLERVLLRLPEAGVRVTTLSGAMADGLVDGSAQLPTGSWGSGKDWRVWQGEQVADVVAVHDDVQRRLLDLVQRQGPRTLRSEAMDQLVRQALLTLASDWPFMVTKDQAADYARSRVLEHATSFEAMLSAIDSLDDDSARRLATVQRQVDGPFGHLDARRLG